tara:strand:- start:176 stop:727 length:552 start_codon:yes stop_codon:yes gene_type:complete
MIQIEDTPNPNALKFLSEKKISSIGTQEFQKKNISTIDNIFIKNLLCLDGVELVLLSDNFLSVKKNDKTSWDSLKPSIISSLNEYFEKNKKPILSKIEEEVLVKKSDEDEIMVNIKNVLDTKVRPAVAKDGGDIKLVSFKDGVVKVELRGSCSGCPSSLMTLKQGVQNLLCHYVKEVKSVEAE